MIDKTTIDKLNMLHDTLQPFIDEVMKKRMAAPLNEKYLWTYVNKKLDLAGKAIGLALDKIDEEETKNQLKMVDKIIGI